MGMAPVSYLVIEFPGNKFKGEIAPILDDMVEREVVRILDLLIVLKDDQGTVAVLELSQLPEEDAFGLAHYAPPEPGLLGTEDIEVLAESLQLNSSAAFLVLEHLWAKPFAEAVGNAGGRWLLMEGVPPNVVEQAMAPSPF